MRLTIRAVLGLSVAFVLATLSLLYLFHDDWAEQVRRIQPLTTPHQHDDSEPPSNPASPKAPSRPAPFKAVVMGRLSSEDTEWVHELPEYVHRLFHTTHDPTDEQHSWEPYVYTVDNTSEPRHTPANRGREAMAYLTYIIDEYASLGTVVAFIHSHRDGFPASWHTDNAMYSNEVSLRALRPSAVLAAGYVNLRCNPQVGCEPPEMELTRDPPDPARAAENALRDLWPGLMGADTPMPATIGVACCAQFAVSGERIRRLPRERWVQIREWLMHAPVDDDVAGRIFEYMWHIIFGMEAEFCPDLGTCYCEVYGWCGEEEA